MENEVPQSEDSTQLKKWQKYCEKERNEAFSSILKQQEESDKQLLTLSTGLLAVLVAFLKDIVHLETSVAKPLLYSSFVFLGATIVFVIVSFQISVIANEKVCEYWLHQYQGDANYAFPDSGGRLVKAFNWAGCASFILGIAFAIGFITANLSHQPKAELQNGQENCRLCTGPPKAITTEKSDDTHGWPATQDPHSCPEGEYCTYKAVWEEQIGVPAMAQKTASKNLPAQPIPSPPICPGLPTKPPIRGCPDKNR